MMLMMMMRVSVRVWVWFSVWSFFLGFYSKLLPPHNITVTRKQLGT